MAWPACAHDGRCSGSINPCHTLRAIMRHSGDGTGRKASVVAAGGRQCWLAEWLVVYIIMWRCRAAAAVTLRMIRCRSKFIP